MMEFLATFEPYVVCVQGSHSQADVLSRAPRRLPERPLLWAGRTDGCETVSAALMRSDPDGGLNRRVTVCVRPPDASAAVLRPT
jgi:hypothetical protein